MKLYLDNCCFNRPFDDQTSLKIRLETQAKLAIQREIKLKNYKLAWSFILEYENNENPYRIRRETILRWKVIASEYILSNRKIIDYAEDLQTIGIKPKDSLHIACAVFSNCDYVLTTDRKLLNLESKDIKICNPIDFVIEMEG